MPVLFATWAYQRGEAKLAAKGWAYDEMVRRLAEVYRKAALDNGVTVRDNLTAVLSPSYPTDTGLILLGAYLYSDYPPADTLTIYGSLNQSEEDKIDYTENVVEIEGDNHAQFGNYGLQKGMRSPSSQQRNSRPGRWRPWWTLSPSGGDK